MANTSELPTCLRVPEWERDVYRWLQQVKGLVRPETVTILLLHYPAVFDYVVELGIAIDLTLAGQTHGRSCRSISSTAASTSAVW
jgi:hypothetical protein